MANFTWSFDAPSGVYKSHEMSAALRKAAIAETKMMQFVKPEPGYGKKSGDTITISRISNLAVPTNGRLSENVKMPEDVLTITSIAITVSEWGRSVPYTGFAEDLSMFDIENIVQRALKDQMKLIMDNAAATSFKAGKIKAYLPGVASITFTTNGAAGGQSLANLNVYHVEQIRDQMFQQKFGAQAKRYLETLRRQAMIEYKTPEAK